MRKFFEGQSVFVPPVNLGGLSNWFEGQPHYVEGVLPIAIEIPSANLRLSSGLEANPPSANLVLTTLFPVEVLYSRNVAPPSANLVLTRSAPLVLNSTRLMIPPSANLVLSRFGVVVERNEYEPRSANLLLTTSSPDVRLSEIIIPSANLSLSKVAPFPRVLVPFAPTLGSVMRMMIITASGQVKLPPDWNPSSNRAWLWGAGGRGNHASEVGALIAGGGGGGGGFDEAKNLPGAAGDTWTLTVGRGSVGKIGNSTNIKNASLVTLATIDSGENGGGAPFAGGGIGGSGGSIPASNSGGAGEVLGGGGGGGGAAGPNTLGTKGGSGGPGGGFGFDLGVGGGGGGGGGNGDFQYPGESPATGGVVGGSSDIAAASGSGGHGYFGHGGGQALAPVVNPTTPPAPGQGDEGGGGAGGAAGIDFVAGFFYVQDGATGGDWDFIQSLPTNAWMITPFSFSTSLNGRFIELSNGTVPAGGGGGGGSGFGSTFGGGHGGNGGRGGFPGGGGGGSGFDSNGLLGGTAGGDNALGGDGADGLIILFYESSSENVCLPCEEDLSPCGADVEPAVDGEWPFELLQPRHVGIHMVPATLGGGPSLVRGLEEISGTNNGFWRFTFGEVPIRSPAQRRAWRKLDMIMDGGRGGVIRLHTYEGKRAPWTLGVPGSAIDIRAEVTFPVGATSGSIRVNSGGTPLPGMHFSYNDRLYRLMSVGSPTGGVYPVSIWPDVRRQIVAGQPLEFRRPTCRARLREDGGMELNLEVLRVANPSVELEEDI